MGRCPCPRCFTEKKCIDGLGTTVDGYRRRRIRTDGETRREKVELTRRWMFVDGDSMQTNRMKGQLEPTSLVPIRVRSSTLPLVNALLTFPTRMHSLYAFPNTASTTTRCLSQTFCTSLSWVFGRQSSSTSYAYYMQTAIQAFNTLMKGETWLF